MTREEAIKWFENSVPKNCSERHKEMDFSVGGCVTRCNYSDSLRCEAYFLARAALCEQEERIKGCRWCWNFQKNPKIVISGHGNKEFVVFFDFCPMCGRKLEVEG